MRSFLKIIEKCFKKLKSSRRRWIFTYYLTLSSKKYLKNLHLYTYNIYLDVVKVLYLSASILKKIKLN
jgi:hypothetical protein